MKRDSMKKSSRNVGGASRWRRMRPGRLGAALLVLLVGAGAWVYCLPTPPSALSGVGPSEEGARFSLGQLLGNAPQQAGFEQADFEQAKPGQPLVFPRDHGEHPGFHHEWWYLSANVQEIRPPFRRFGLQLTQFRFALAPLSQADGAPTNNHWLRPQVYMGHLAITHVRAGEHRRAERFSRPGAGLAGVGGSPLRIWLENWTLEAESPGSLVPLRLQADDAGTGIGARLQLRALKPRVLQGDAGLSVKNSRGDASYYYSYPRLSARGRLNWDGEAIEVAGLAWFDHEWSSNSLSAEQAGWDWFSLQLDSGEELMFYRFRNRDGREGLSHVVLIDPQGLPRPVARQALQFETLGEWRSPSGVTYPARWRLQIDTLGVDIQVKPLLADQEMDLSVRYWEGAVAVSGSHQGYGYVELAGYE